METTEGKQERAIPAKALREAARTRDRFAGNVKKHRELLDMSQRTLAEKTGLSISYISMIESRKRDPSLPVVHAVANALKQPPSALVFGA